MECLLGPCGAAPLERHSAELTVHGVEVSVPAIPHATDPRPRGTPSKRPILKTTLPTDRRYGPPALTTPVFPLLPSMPPPQGLRLDDDDESVFVVVRWQGSGASYFRSAQVDRTRRARPARCSIGGPELSGTPRGDDWNDARVRWDSRDGVSAFRNDACYLHPAATGGDRGEVPAFDSIPDDDNNDDDDDEPTRGTARRHLPWEVRLAVCASRPGSIYGTTERVIGEGTLNLADFVGTNKNKARGLRRVQLEMIQPGSATASAAAETSSRPAPPRLSLSVAVARSPGLASKAAASLGGKGSRDRAVAGKLFSYLSGPAPSPRDGEKGTGRRRGGAQGRRIGRSSPRSSEEGAASSDGFTSDGAMDTCESDAERGASPPSTPPRGSESSDFKKPTPTVATVATVTTVTTVTTMNEPSARIHPRRIRPRRRPRHPTSDARGRGRGA